MHITKYIPTYVHTVCIHHTSQHAMLYFARILSWPFWSWHLGLAVWFQHPEVVWRLLESVGCILTESKNSWMKSKKNLRLSSVTLPSTNLVAPMKHENWSHRSSVGSLDFVGMAIHATQQWVCDSCLWRAINLHEESCIGSQKRLTGRIRWELVWGLIEDFPGTSRREGRE